MIEKKFSKSLKSSITKGRDKQLLDSLDASEHIPNVLNSFLRPDDSKRGVIGHIEDPIRFTSSLKFSLGDFYSSVVKIYERSRILHNLYLANTVFPDDILEWANYSEVSDMQSEIDILFSDIGKQLAYKKRRESASNAQRFLFKSVLHELDEITFSDNHHLSFFFDHSIDLLAQSFLSNFIMDAFDTKEAWHKERHWLDIQAIATFDNEKSFLTEQIQIYNVVEYLWADQLIDEIARGILEQEYDIRMEFEDIVFDIFEMIPLYIKSFKPKENPIRLSDTCVAYPSIEFGAPAFSLVHDKMPIERITLTPCKLCCSVSGELRFHAKLDMSSIKLKPIGEFLLSQLYDLLLANYSKRTDNSTITEKENELFIYQYHAALIDVASNDTAPIIASEIRPPVPSMSMSSFFKHMKSHFACSVEQGKGSEMKIWRQDSHIYTIGKHKKDQKLHSFLIRKVLKRLEVSTSDWLESLKK